MDLKFLKKYTKQYIDKNGNTLLHKAVKESNFILLFKAAFLETSVNKQNTDGYSALHYAVKHGDLLMVEAVLQCGVSPLLKSKIGETAKEMAMRNKKTDLVALLDRYGSGLEYHIVHRDTRSCIDLLNHWVSLDNVVRSAVQSRGGASFTENVAAMDFEFYRQRNKFIHLVASDSYEEVEGLLLGQCQEKCIDINSTHSANGATPLSLAIQNCNPKMVNLLLDHGANPSVRLSDGRPLTHYCWDISAPFQVILCLLRDQRTWHMRSPTGGLTIFLSLVSETTITAVHVHKLLEVTQCAVLMDRDGEGRDFHEYCSMLNRWDLIESIHESVAELLGKRTGKLALIRLAVGSLGHSVLDVPDEVFRKVYGEGDIQSMVDMYRQFRENLCSLEMESTKLFDAVRRDDIAAVKRHNIADFINKRGRTALHEAILQDAYDIVVWLLAERPGLRMIGDLHNRYPLHYAYAVASQYGKKYVHLLLDSGDSADMEKLTDVNNTIPSALSIDMKQLSQSIQ